MGCAFGNLGTVVHTVWIGAGNFSDCLWILRQRSAGLVAVGTARLPFHIRQVGCGVNAGSWHLICAAQLADAAADTIY